MKLLKPASIVMGVSIVLGGCGGGGSSGSPGAASGPAPAANTAPTMTGLPAEKVLLQDASSDVIAFSVGDAESGAGTISVTVESSAPDIVSSEAILVQGNGSSRGIVVTPVAGAAGIATVTVKAMDSAGLTTSQPFRVSVTGEQRSFREMVGTVFAQGAESEGEPTVGYSWVDNPEQEEAAFDHLLN